MKKNILAFTAVLSLAVLFSGCGNAEEAPSELDMLLEQLQTTHLNTGTPENAEDADETTENLTYKSSTGTLVSFTDSSITIKNDNKEQKFLLDENTKILGGELASAEAVTVTYNEADGNEKNLTADIITVLSLNDENTDSETAVPETDSSDASDTQTDASPEDSTSDISDTETAETTSTQSEQPQETVDEASSAELQNA